MGKKSAIIGLHHANEGFLFSLEQVLGRREYTLVETVKTPEAMAEKCSAKDYDLYIMDVNLGLPEGYDFSCALRVYERIKPRVDAGEIKFYPLAGLDDVVEDARKEGLPALFKGEFIDRMGELLGPVE